MDSHKTQCGSHFIKCRVETRFNFEIFNLFNKYPPTQNHLLQSNNPLQRNCHVMSEMVF